MNRILFEKDEIVDNVVTFGGARAEHVLDVLHGEVGQILKTGEVNGPIGTGEIVAIGVDDRCRCGKEEEDSAVDLHLKPTPKITVKISHNEQSLAPPRPRVMKRLLPQMAAMGVGRIVLVGAEKVEKDFWGATLLKEENYRPLLIDGLMQCGTSILPTIETWKSFNRFMREGLPAMAHQTRIIAHPYESKFKVQGPKSKDQSALNLGPSALYPRALLAIGPEGGWTDAEVEKLEQAGFVRYSLGRRILRTDTATIALLARLQPSEEN